jgi:hypothetical protein
VTDGQGCNDRVASNDVTVVRKGIAKVGVGFVSAALVASAGVAGSQATSVADPAAGHQVRYTLTTAAGADFDLYYLAAQPPSKAAYDSDSYTYLKKESVSLAPGQPWTFDATLADPNWAIFTVSSTTHGGREAPNPHCEISVDGQVAVQQDAPYNLQCRMPNSVI